MSCKSAVMTALLAVLSSTALCAEESVVAPAPTPAPTAGPTKAAAEGFCGEPAAAAEALIAKYSAEASLKQVYKSAEFVAYADNEKAPTVMYTFTVQGQAAHPAAVCRRIVKEGDAAVIKMSIVCDGNAESCTKLKNDFNVMTAQMQAEVDNKIKSGGK